MLIRLPELALMLVPTSVPSNVHARSLSAWPTEFMLASVLVRLINREFDPVVNSAVADTGPSVTVAPIGVKKVMVLPKALTAAKPRIINNLRVFCIFLRCGSCDTAVTHFVRKRQQ